MVQQYRMQLMDIHIKQCYTENNFLEAARDILISSSRSAIERHGTFRLALSGGSTPKKFYNLLSQEKLDWDSFEIIQVDERYVERTNAASNYRMIDEALFSVVKVSSERKFFFRTDMPREDAVTEMDARLHDLAARRLPLIDLTVLGAGTDGHIASLFEGSQAIYSEQFADVAQTEFYPIRERMTLTTKALSMSSGALMLLYGSDKMPVVESMIGNENIPLTAFRILAQKVHIDILYCCE
jgi:6-phosphogluconolactonase